MQKLLTIGGAVGLIAGGVLLTAGLARVGERPAKLTWRDPEIKSALMTLGYKVYANPKVEFGRHYLSKLVFKNTGEHPITDFSISYKLDDYIAWTDPEEVHEIPAGFTLVKLFYPKLPAQVTKIRNATNATSRMRVLWKEEGRQHDESFARDIVLRGVNELSYCDLPESELRTHSTVLTWLDLFNASAFSVCMVTPNDPVVSLYAAEITKLAGGTTAGIAGGPKEIGRLCRITYDYMMATELRYTGDSGVPANFDNISTLVQTVRLPRDVIQNNQGLCIELSILWSAVLEHLGVQSAMVFIPGHVFVVAYSPDQNLPLAQGLPIECTAITPRAVGKDAPVPFDEAVKMAAETWAQAQKDGRMLVLPVQDLQEAGYISPELADIDMDKLTETLAKRLPHAGNVVLPVNGGGLPNINGGGALPVQPVTGAMNTWRHPQGLVSISFPADFVSLLQPGAPGFILLSVGNPGTTVGCDVMQITGTQDPTQAINYVAGVFAQMGAMIQVTGSTPMSNGAIMLNGTTTSSMASVRWICMAKPVVGGVVLVSAGANPNAWAAQSATIQAILSTVRFN